MYVCMYFFKKSKKKKICNLVKQLGAIIVFKPNLYYTVQYYARTMHGLIKNHV